MEESFKIRMMDGGVFDLGKNASDFSKLVYDEVLRHQNLCASMSLLFFDPAVPDLQKQWKLATYLPLERYALHPDFEVRIRDAMKYIGEQVSRILDGQEVICPSCRKKGGQ